MVDMRFILFIDYERARSEVPSVQRTRTAATAPWEKSRAPETKAGWLEGQSGDIVHADPSSMVCTLKALKDIVTAIVEQIGVQARDEGQDHVFFPQNCLGNLSPQGRVKEAVPHLDEFLSVGFSWPGKNIILKGLERLKTRPEPIQEKLMATSKGLLSPSI
jgi:hypothetical protein